MPRLMIDCKFITRQRALKASYRLLEVKRTNIHDRLQSVMLTRTNWDPRPKPRARDINVNRKKRKPKLTIND